MELKYANQNKAKDVIHTLGVQYEFGVETFVSNKYPLRKTVLENEYIYPLIEKWGWSRDKCMWEIKAAGLPLPGKSSCFFCPSMTQQEILYLKKYYPDLFQRAVALEENAMPYLKTVKGLGRNYSWKDRFGADQPC